MKSSVFRVSQRLLVVTIAGAMGVAAPASVCLAQATHATPGAPAAKGESRLAPPPTVSGVVVQAPPKLNRIPPAKRAAFDAEAARRKAWTTYRATAPSAGAKTLGASPQTENYPGLRALPH